MLITSSARPGQCAAAIDPFHHFILIRDGKLIKVGGVGAYGLVSAVWAGMYDNSSGISKAPSFRETIQIDSTDSGGIGDNPDSFVR